MARKDRWTWSFYKWRKDRVEKVDAWNRLMEDAIDGMWMGGRCGEIGRGGQAVSGG